MVRGTWVKRFKKAGEVFNSGRVHAAVVGGGRAGMVFPPSRYGIGAGSQGAVREQAGRHGAELRGTVRSWEWRQGAGGEPGTAGDSEPAPLGSAAAPTARVGAVFLPASFLTGSASP